MRRSSLPCLLVLAAALLVHADEVDDLIDVVRGSLTADHPMIAFYDELLELADFDLGEAEVARVVGATGAPVDGPVADTLDSIVRFTKTGNRLRVRRNSSVTVRTPEGITRMGTLVECRVRSLASGDVVVDEISGVRAGASASFLFRLRKVVYTFDGDAPVARATVGTWPFVRTVTMAIESSDTGGGLVGGVSAP